MARILDHLDSTSKVSTSSSSTTADSTPEKSLHGCSNNNIDSRSSSGNALSSTSSSSVVGTTGPKSSSSTNPVTNHSHSQSPQHTHDSLLWHSLLAMAFANALHYVAYELARSSVAALLTTHLPVAAGTLATGAVSPCAVAVLWGHRRVMDVHGPRTACRVTTALYSASMGVAAAMLLLLVLVSEDDSEGQQQHAVMAKVLLRQATIVFVFVVKNAFVYLLSAQHWSFLTTVLKHLQENTKTTQSPSVSSSSSSSTGNHDSSRNTALVARWTTVIAGVGSVGATLAAAAVSPLLHYLTVVWTTTTDRATAAAATAGNETNHGNNTLMDSDGPLYGLLMAAAIVLCLAGLCSDRAHHLAQDQELFGFGSSSSRERTSASKSNNHNGVPSAKTTLPLHRRALDLVRRIPVLGALCVEVLVWQCVSAFLSFLFATHTKESHPDPQQRAQYHGTVYTRINFGSGVLQFLVLPWVLGRTTTKKNAKTVPSRYLWLVTPCLVSGLAAVAVGHSLLWSGNADDDDNSHDGASQSTSLLLTHTFTLMKILDYSVRSVVTELVYGSLEDTETRYFGKELCGFFANRLGKSATAVGLAMVSWKVPAFVEWAPVWLVLASGAWTVVSYRLVQLLGPGTHKEKVE